jgi:uncharacterized protein
VIVADTSALIALMHAADRHHAVIRTLFESTGSQWVLPWAILPEVDYILATRAGRHVQRLWLDDLAEGDFVVGWGTDLDLTRARQIDQQFADLGLGLVDACVLAYAERQHASAIVTLDRRHFGPVTLQAPVPLLPDA